VQFRRSLRRLDPRPAPAAVLLGLATGGTLGAVLAGLPLPYAIPGVAAVLALAVWLAWSGEPLPILVAPNPPPSPEPRPVTDLWAPIPAGTFQMGSPEDEPGRLDREGSVHPVRVSAFLCLRTPVTRKLYQEITGQDPGWSEGEADERPVNNVSWLDAMRFCNRWSERDGLEPCYRFEGEAVTWDRVRNGYRLLTEAEWEYACRAGSRTRWCFGDDEAKLGDYAWYEKNSQGQPQPVGQLEPNVWELHDMHGNVWEWCWDWYGPYPSEAQIDPMGPLGGEYRVLRGGTFNIEPWLLRSASRSRFQPEYWGRYYGFRCARAAPRQR
jgi:formylglycine-generating enzyme required for sulfatase activity